MLAVVVVIESPPGPARRVVVVAWFAVVCFVPVWLGVQIRFPVMPAVMVGVVLVGVLALLRPVRPCVLGVGDLLFVSLFVCCAVPAVTGHVAPDDVFILVSQWTLGYVLGRLMLTRVPLGTVYGVATGVFVLVGLLAVAEFVTGTNVFTQLVRDGRLYEEWGTLQERGGLLRAEGAFGHSLALGVSTAIAVPFVLGSGLRDRWKAVALAVLGAAVVVTFSRTAMLCFVFATGLVLLLGGPVVGRWFRIGVVGLGCVAALGVALFVGSVFTAAGSEATESGEYRGDLLELVPTMVAFGSSPARQVAGEGEVYYRAYHSIDNALILSGLRYGWVPVVVMVVAWLLAVVQVLNRRATMPVFALVATAPALVTVAFITQYEIFVFFIAGLAATPMRVGERWRTQDTNGSRRPPAALTAVVAGDGR